MNMRWLLVCCLSLSFGCGAALSEGPGSITALRAEAAGSPTDPVLQQRLALAEMFSYEGDPASVDGQLQRALAVDPKSPRLWLALGLHADSHGRPGLALDAYLHALALCPRSTDPIAPQLAELAVHAVGGLEGSVTDYHNKVLPALQALLSDRDLALPARYGVAGLLAQLAYRRGDRPAAQGFAENVGCITRFRGAGPFGPRELLSFDQRHAAAPGKPLAASYDLGPGRGVSPTRELGARGCSVSLGGGPVARGGTSYAQTFVELQRRGAYSLRFESPNAAEVFLDGRSILRVDRRQELAPDVLYVPLDLDAGRHEFTVKLTTRHPNPAIAFALAPRRAQDEAGFALPFTPDAQEGFAVYARAAIAGVRGDVLSARQILDKIDVSAKPSALLLMLRAGLLLSDPLMPNDSREDDARRLLSAALERDPGVWHPRVQLADMAAGHGRPKEAIADLREQMNRFPEVPTIGLTLAQLLRAQQWDAEADAVIAKMRKLVPDGCAPLSAELEALRNRNREQKAAEVAEALERCEGQANARYALLLRQRHWDAAQKELERLAALEPPQNRYPWLLARMELAKNRGDDAAVERQITELRALYPRATTGTLEEIDRLGARGDTAGALSVLQQALEREPASMAELNRLVPVLGGKHVLDAYRIDGEAAIKRFEASGRSYDAPQVLVFDYMAVAVLQDGSSVELVHTIEKAQSDE
ncbi:MAG: tetratricopeptide repeat protein, partial [Polyangiales bacterium]